MSELKDLNELINIAKKINEGKYDLVQIDIDPQSELYEIADYFNSALKTLRTVTNAFEDSMEDLPQFEMVLEEVVSDSKTASESVLMNVDNLNFNLDEIKENVKKLHECIDENDPSYAVGLIDRLMGKSIEGQDLCFDIIASLEFQDISKQKITKLIKIVKDLEKRIADIIIKLGLKTNKIDVDTLSNISEKEDILEDQGLVDELLKELGL